MKPKCKTWISLVCALAMLVSLLPTTALATDGDGSTSGSASSVTIDKTATDLDENLNTTVTLSVDATESKDKVAVLFLLDKSTSQGMRDEAAGMLDVLAQKTNTDILYDVVIFSGTARASGWKNIQDTDTLEIIKSNFVNGATTSGTNMDAGIALALSERESLPAAYADAATYLITLSDGITYVWTGEDGSVKCVPVEGLHDTGVVEVSAQNGPDTWSMMYEYGKSFTEIYGSFNNFLSAAPDKMQATSNEKHVQDYLGETPLANPIHTYIYDDVKTAEIAKQYACGIDFAVYESATGYQNLVNRFDYSYAYAVPELDDNCEDNDKNWEDFPWGKELMEYCHSLSTNKEEDVSVSNADAARIFASIRDQILYTIKSGSIHDVIGSSFDLVSLQSFQLTVGDQTLTPVVNEAAGTVTFATEGNETAYVVTYVASDASGAEYFDFAINTPVSASAGLKLSYQLKLTNPDTTVAVNETHKVPTNESATLTYYTSTDSTTPKTETFPIPEVSYYLASIQPADMTIYMGGDAGYGGVSNEVGEIVANNSLPEPGYYITLPDAVNQALAEAGLSGSESEPADLSNLIKIRTKDSDPNHYWTLSPYGNSYSAAYGKYIYAVVQGDDSAPFRLTFTDVNDPSNTFDSDSFTPATEGALNQEYTMNIYQELINSKELLIEVSIPDHGSYYCIATTQPGTLDIRYVTGDQDSVVTPAYDSVEKASAADDPNKTALDNAYVVRGENTKFFINDSSVDVTESEDFAQVSLLFDDVVTTSTTDDMPDYATLLRDQAIAQVAQSFENVQYQAKYLDLVDANNGNVWLTPSEDVTVYWPYPEGTDANTTFYLVHFEDMDREMSNTEIADAINSATKELIPVTTDAYGISFQTNSFSPYVLLWDAKTTQPETTPSQPSNPGTTVTPTATPAPTTAPVGTPATGDATPVALFGGAAVLAAVVLAALIVVRKRYNR